MSKVRICFLGTPEFALVALKELSQDEHYEIVGVVTQPDRPAGRKMQLTPSPVKSFCLQQGLTVISPESIKHETILQEIEKWGAEVAVVVAYGQILPQKFLELFPFGAVNVHGSILPRWRGAAPIQRALEAGDQESGVTLQKVVKELDAGDILGIRKFNFDDHINATEAYDQLAKLGADLLKIEFMDYVRGNLAPTAQDSTRVTYAKKIDKSEAEIKWSKTAKQIHDQVRAFTMGPGTWTLLANKKIKIHKTEFDLEEQKDSQQKTLNPGQICQLDSDGFWVQTGKGKLKILMLQPESRNRLTAGDFLKSQTLAIGEQLG